MVGRLLTAAEDCDALPPAGREVTRAESASCGCSRGSDLRAVEHGGGNTGFRVVEDDCRGDVRQPFLLVGRVARDPLECDHVLIGEIGGHRVEEAVGARVYPRLRRQLDAANRERAVCLLGKVDLFWDRRHQRLDLLAPQVEELWRHQEKTASGIVMPTFQTPASTIS